MAKAAAKKKTLKTKSEKEPQQEQKVSAGPIAQGMVSIVISEEDLVTFTNLMTICAKTFEQLAYKAADDNDTTSFKTLQARYQLSTVFANKLSDCIKMPEPVSREFH
jgi:hypothetical protein